MKSTVLAFVVLTPVLLTSSVTIAAPPGSISTMSCTLTQHLPGESIVQPVVLNFGYGSKSELKSVTVKLVKGGRVLVSVRPGLISYRMSADSTLKMQDYASDDGIQKCDFTETSITAVDGVSIKAKCDILPESGMPVETRALFDLQIASSSKQDYGQIRVGNKQYQVGYSLNQCTAK